MIGAGLVRNFAGQINTIKAAVLASLSGIGGAALVGESGGGTVQAKLTAQATLLTQHGASLSALSDPGGAALVGESGGGTVQDALTAQDGRITQQAADLAASGGAGLVGFMRPEAGAVPRPVQAKLWDLPIDAADFGVTAGAADVTAAFQGLIAACFAGGRRTIQLPPGVINVTGLQVSGSGLRLLGAYQARGDATNGGTQLNFIGAAGALIQLGADDGQPWNASLYNGPQGLQLENLDLLCSSPNRTTPLALAGNYAAGCYGIRDWRGGDVKLRNVSIEGFEYNFWGVNSDFNTFYQVTSLYSKYGIYAGPKTDQFTINDLYSFYCDHAITVDGAAMMVLNAPKIVICGSTTEAAINIRRGSGVVVIRDPWFENFSGLANQLAFVSVGTEDGYGSNTAFVTGTVIDNALIGTGNPGTAGSTKYLVVLGNARNVVIDNPVAGNGLSLTTNLLSLAAFAAGIDHSASNSSLRVRAAGSYSTAKLFTNLGTGTANVFFDQDESGNQLGSVAGRLYINRLGGSVGAETLRISTENAPGQFVIATPTYTGGQTQRLTLRKAWADNSARPSSGSYEVGDFVRNTAPAVAGAAGSQYLVMGWMRMTTGSTHVAGTDWAECRTLTGT